MDNNQNLIFKDQLHTGQILTSPVFGDGTVIAIFEDGFSVKFIACQFVYKDDGCIYPNGKKQAVFIK